MRRRYFNKYLNRGLGDCSGGPGTIDPSTGLVCLDTSAVTLATTPLSAPQLSATEAAGLNAAMDAQQYAQSSFLGPVATPSTTPPAFQIPWGAVALAAGVILAASFMGGGRR